MFWENTDCSMQRISVKLSEAMDDIGVNDVMIKKRRRGRQLHETMYAISLKIRKKECERYTFGSKIEGSTTLGLHSDTDILFVQTYYNVIQRKIEWKPKKCNFLMVRDKNTPPGYCLLQLVRESWPVQSLVWHTVLQENLENHAGKILLKNSLTNHKKFRHDVENGPAFSSKRVPGFTDLDVVYALPCSSWPDEALKWFKQYKNCDWLTNKLTEEVKKTTCLVVPVGKKGSQNEHLQWRISFAVAERCLMFTLNITQMRCYILMKMILKTFVEPKLPNILSSYMCKHVLFHCIASSKQKHWTEPQLLYRTLECLTKLTACIRQKECPHFIMPSYNLMAGKFTGNDQILLTATMDKILESNGQKLLDIQINWIGNRLRAKLNAGSGFFMFIPAEDISKEISGLVAENTIECFSDTHKMLLHTLKDHTLVEAEQFCNEAEHKLKQYKRNGSDLEKQACGILLQMIYTLHGSVTACLNSENVSLGISRKSFSLFKLGFNTDVASSRLKLASALYCTADTIKLENILDDLHHHFSSTLIEPICACYNNPTVRAPEFYKVSHVKNENILQTNAAFCVRFLSWEINIMPKELQYEMYRSTKNEKEQREKKFFWFDWAIVDSVPYMYFLQYKTWPRVGNITRLIDTLVTEKNLSHKETAWNLLGQCLEMEYPSLAFLCFVNSLKFRPTNNAARIHLCRLLARIINQ